MDRVKHLTNFEYRTNRQRKSYYIGKCKDCTKGRTAILVEGYVANRELIEIEVRRERKKIDSAKFAFHGRKCRGVSMLLLFAGDAVDLLL